MSRAVIDQPGLRIFLVGVCLSLFLGLALRSQISESQLSPHIEKAVNRLSQDLKIDFKKASVKLSSWGLPLPYIQIDEIRISPKALGCQDSQLFIKQIQLPIRILSLFTGHGIIEKIRISEAEVRLAKLENCFNQPSSKVSVSQPATDEGNLTKSISAVPSTGFFQRRSATSLKQIHIDQLRLIMNKYPGQPISVKNMNFDISYEMQKLKDINLTSQLYAIKDLTSEVLFFKGDLRALFRANQIGDLDVIANMNGQILDGRINLFSTYSSMGRIIQSEVHFEKISTKVLSNLPFFSDPTTVKILSNLPLYVNFEASGVQRLEQNEFDYKLKDLRLFSSDSVITTSEVELYRKNKKTHISDFVSDFSGFNLDHLRSLPEMHEVSKSIERFGQFTGKLHAYPSVITDEFSPKIDLSGVLQNVSFIFSNRGQRELQFVDSAQLSVQKDVHDANLELSQIKANGKEIKGQIHSKIDLTNSEVIARADLKGELLNSVIWRQLTEVEQSPEVSLKWNYKRNYQEKHDLSMAISSLQSPGLELKDLKLELVQHLKNTQSESLSMSVTAETTLVTPTNLTNDSFKNIFTPNNFLGADRYISDHFQLNLNGPTWKQLSFSFESNLKEDASKPRTQRVYVLGKVLGDDSAEGTLEVQDYVKSQKVLRKFSKSVTTPLVLTN